MTNFDLHLPQQAVSFTFDVLDASLTVKNQVLPDASSTINIENATTRPIKRVLRGFRVPPSQLSAFNPVTDRIRPSVTIGGSTYPLGVFLFNDGSSMPRTYGAEFTGAMVDQGLILNDQLPVTFSLLSTASIREGIIRLLEDAGITADRYMIDTADGSVGNPGAVWPAGTVRSQIINELCAMIGCFPIYFTNAGIARVRVIDTNLALSDPILAYWEGVNILDGTIVDTNTAITAPNRFIVTDTGAKGSAVSGVYDLPASAPQAEANIGYFRTQTVTEQGLGTQADAEARAYAAALLSLQDARWVSFSGLLDPRHDTFDTIRFEGVPFRETDWSVDLVAGGEMKHSLRQVWSLS